MTRYRSTGGTAARHAWLAGICADLAADFDLSPGTVRILMLLFAVLPAGLVYLALMALMALSGQRPATGRTEFYGARPAASPLGHEASLVQQRFASLDRRLGAIEAFVSSKDFELHKGFRQMRQ